MTTLDLTHLTPKQVVRFNAISEEVRGEFNEVIEAASAPHVHNINWIVGSIASRNKYTSPLYERLCSLAFIESELAREHGHTAVVVADRGLARVLRRQLGSRHDLVGIRCTQGIGSRVWNVFRPIRQYLIGVWMLSLRFIAKSRKSQAPAGSATPLTLIDTFVLNNAAGDEGSIVKEGYRDRYYPGLFEQLTKEEQRGILFIPTVVGFQNPIRAFRSIRQTNTPFLIHDDLLGISDYLFAAFHPFRLLRCRIPRLIFRSFDITQLVRHEHIRNCADNMGYIAMLYYRFAFRLAQGVADVRTLIVWYENQAIDRALILGFHRFLPSVRVVGYQGFIIAKSLHLYALPNSSEVEGNAVPDTVYVIGKDLQRDLREFAGDIDVRVAPGFRFQRLWANRENSPDDNWFTILVGLPIDLTESARILEILSAGLAEIQSRNVRFFVKPHPTWDSSRIIQLLPGSWPEEFTFQMGDFHDALEKSDLLISSASSVALEAVAKGVPAVIIGSLSGIDQNPIPDSVPTEVWKLVRTAEECVNAIRWFEDLETTSRLEFERIGEDIRRRYFEPVSRNGVVELLGLDL